MTCQDSLTPWQQAQAAILAYFASTPYLQYLHDVVLSLQDGRLSPLRQDQHGPGSRGLRWQRYDWAFLGEISAWTTQNLVLRRHGIYRKSNASERMMNAHMTAREYMGADEVEAFDAVTSLVGRVSDRLDRTLSLNGHGGWNDHGLSRECDRHALFARLESNFAPNSAFVCATGAAVPRTGIYMALDDPHATLRFAWAGKDAPPMPKASTFNILGLEALEVIGRDRLWRDDAAMRAFINRAHVARQLERDGWWRDRDSPSVPVLLLSSYVFETLPMNWILVEARADAACNATGASN